jgi:hypothetical protein
MPCEAAVTVASESCRAQVRLVDVGRASIDDDVQFDAVVCSLDHTGHEPEVVAAFIVDGD